MNRIFAYFPHFEVLIRHIYYSDFYKKILCYKFFDLYLFVKIKNFFNKLFYKEKINEKSHENYFSDEFFKEELKRFVNELNDLSDDYVLLVHSKSEYLKSFNISPNEFLDILIKSLKNNGTLAMPFMYPQKASDNTNEVNVNIDNKITTSGLLPNLLARMENSYITTLPSNGLVALGPKAKYLFKDEPQESYFHGNNSSWNKILSPSCKVLFVGVDPSKTFTSIHIAEDTNPLKWPISGWYEKVQFNIKHNNNLIKKLFFVRSQKWSKYMSSQYRTRYLLKRKLMIKMNIRSFTIFYVPSLIEVITEVRNQAENKNLQFFKIPKRFYK